MKEDLALTATGAPAAVLGDKRYPLVFTVAGMKEWAEHRGQTFEEVLRGGWDAQDLTGEDLAILSGSLSPAARSAAGCSPPTAPGTSPTRWSTRSWTCPTRPN